MPQFWFAVRVVAHKYDIQDPHISALCVLLLIVCTFSWFDCFLIDSLYLRCHIFQFLWPFREVEHDGYGLAIALFLICLSELGQTVDGLSIAPVGTSRHHQQFPHTSTPRIACLVVSLPIQVLIDV